MKKKLKNFWKKYETKIVLVIGLILVSVISFELGILQGGKLQKEPIVIEKNLTPLVVYENNNANNDQAQVAGTQTNSKNSNSSDKNNLNPESKKQECQFVGSKNSNKYHLNTCSWAKRIKPENRVCFKDAEDAKNKGYVPANCLKK